LLKKTIILFLQGDRKAQLERIKMGIALKIF